MTLTRWQRPEHWSMGPVRRIATLRNGMDSLFNLALSRLLESPLGLDSTGNNQLVEGWFPAVDIYDDKESVVVKAEVPGMKKEDIEISLHDGFLSFSGERKHETQHDSEENCRSERSLGRFQRSISLPCQVDAEKITATYTDGILTVTLPKAEEAKPKQIPITVK